MVDVDKAVVIRLKKSGMDFEILADPDKTLEFKKGKSFDIGVDCWNFFPVNEVELIKKMRSFEK